MEFVSADLTYYQRTIAKMYQNYYWKRITITSVALLIIMGYSAFFQEHLLTNSLIGVVLLALLIYFFHQKSQFPEIFDSFEKKLLVAPLYQIEEDEYSYLATNQAGERIRINKNGARNLPSQNKAYTLLVGFSKTFFAQRPLQIVYYDLLELSYEEQFRLKRNGYSRVPRFLRRFSLGNIKTGIGNLFSFVLGNLFILFIIYRLLRYLLSFIRFFF